MQPAETPKTHATSPLTASHRELDAMACGRTRLYLVRHGELTTSREWRYVGHSDVDLNDAGVAQIKKLARRLQREAIDVLFCSDLRRTVHSARLIGEALGLQPLPDPAFRELNLGCWEGLTRDEIIARFPQEFDARSRDIAAYRIEGGESFEDLQHRVVARLSEVLEVYTGKNVLLVAHGGVNRVILCHALGLALQNLARIDQAYACLNIIDYFDGMPVVRLFNETVEPDR